MSVKSQIEDSASDIDRIDAALAELRRLGRPHRSRRESAGHQESGHREHGSHHVGFDTKPGRGAHQGHERRRHHDDFRHVGLARHRVLSVLERRPGLGVTEIAEAVGVDQPRASRLVNDATDAGLLRRSPDPRDGRRSVVELTAAGREHLQRTLRERRAALTSGLADFTESETATLATLLERFVEGLRNPPAAG